MRSKLFFSRHSPINPIFLGLFLLAIFSSPARAQQLITIASTANPTLEFKNRESTCRILYVGFVGSTLQLPVALAVLLCVLILRPAGLFGRATVRRV